MPSVQGGVWTNVEDEILKAAVSKYGKNQWARISSLLVRKSPKQCKARWYEWLDPSIKKVEWTRDEDEKLLHLAKLLPTQWRTIAPIVGRTATQCLERYQKLLDDAEAAEQNELGLSGPGSESAAPTGDSVRRLRPGELDPDPETKPAKPDAIDMDEDEKEMLSEARARLANTQGKKAKRKQREKLMSETKRLSVVQKRRELKTAGINIKLNYKKKNEMDYNADIPFEHQAAIGFYDTTEEFEANERLRTSMDYEKINKRLQDEAASAEERRTGKKRDSQDADKAEKPIRADHAALDKLRKAEQLTKRRKLNLPAPQVSDRELEDLVKQGTTSTQARELAEAQGSAASQELLGQYTSINTGQPTRTPRTPALQDNINVEARNLRMMTSTQSSLLGGENTPLHGAQAGTGYSGVTPQRQTAATPSSLQKPGQIPQQTLIPRTPRRDNLDSDSNQQQLITTNDKLKTNELKRKFATLPAPKNDFELELPEDNIDEAIDLSNDDIEDASERDARLQRIREESENIARRKRTQVIQRNLPRPTHLDTSKLLAGAKSRKDPANELIAEEMARLLVSDAVKYPLPGTKIVGRAVVANDLELEELESARALINAELKLGPEHVSTTPNYLGDAKIELQELQRTIPLVNERLQEQAIRLAKTEKKLNILLGGFQNRSKLLSSKITEAGAALQQAHIDQESFKRLQVLEDAAILTRLDSLSTEVTKLETINKDGQSKYALLKSRVS